MVETSPPTGILISDLKYCSNDYVFIVQKGILCPPPFLFHPTNQACCHAAVDEIPGQWLHRAGQESQCLISMFPPLSSSPPSHPALGTVVRRDIKRATANQHYEAPLQSILSHQQPSSRHRWHVEDLPGHSKFTSKCRFFSGACPPFHADTFHKWGVNDYLATWPQLPIILGP